MYDWIGLEIGHADDLSDTTLHRMVRNVKALIQIVPSTTAIDISMGGYDEDPRGIFEIPEARRYVISFAAELMYAGVPLDRLLPTSVKVVELCLAAEQGRPVIISDTVTIDIGRLIQEHQDRARRAHKQ
jgi:hypothetical protein